MQGSSLFVALMTSYKKSHFPIKERQKKKKTQAVGGCLHQPHNFLPKISLYLKMSLCCPSFFLSSTFSHNQNQKNTQPHNIRKTSQYPKTSLIVNLKNPQKRNQMTHKQRQKILEILPTNPTKYTEKLIVTFQEILKNPTSRAKRAERNNISHSKPSKAKQQV